MSWWSRRCGERRNTVVDAFAVAIERLLAFGAGGHFRVLHCPLGFSIRQRSERRTCSVSQYAVSAVFYHSQDLPDWTNYMIRLHRPLASYQIFCSIGKAATIERGCPLSHTFSLNKSKKTMRLYRPLASCQILCPVETAATIERKARGLSLSTSRRR